MKILLIYILLFLFSGCKEGIIIDNTKDLVSFEGGLSIYLVKVTDKTVIKLIPNQNINIGFHSSFWINEQQLGFLFTHFNATPETEYPLGIYDFSERKFETRFNPDFPIFELHNATRLSDTSIIFSIQSYEINVFKINSLEVTVMADIYEFGLERSPIHMRISPDRSYIVFSGLDSAKFQLLPRTPTGYIREHSDSLDDIYVYNLSEKTLTQLTNTNCCDRDPTWVPDGEHIAFSSNRSGNYEIYEMDKNGKNINQLTDNPAKDTDPEFSPKSDRIAFVSDRSGHSQIWLMRVDGSDVQQLTDLEDGAYGPLSWSPAR